MVLSIHLQVICRLFGAYLALICRFTGAGAAYLSPIVLCQNSLKSKSPA